jgi:3-oxoadipate enol-lactonase
MNDSSISQSGTWVDVDRGRVYCETSGGGPPVILVHAGIGDRRIWDPVIPRLASSYQVTRYDIRGFGNSPAPDIAFSPVDDLAAVADSVSAGPVAIIGMSTGAGMTIDLALARPGRAGALVLASPAVSGWPPPEDPVFDAVAAAAREGRADEAVDLELGYWAPLGTTGHGGAQLSRLAHDNAATMLLDDDLVIEPPPAVGRLAEIGVPALVVVGDRDVDHVKRIAGHLHSELPRCRLAIIENADHILTLRQPEAFTDAVMNFLAEVWD